MTTEEKAKDYDEALEAARKELGVDRKEWEVVQRVLHNIFPELRESEDERIRKEMIEFLNQYKEDGLRGVDITPWLAYLEKQKEQEGYEAIPVESTLEYKLGFKAGKESEKQKTPVSNDLDEEIDRFFDECIEAHDAKIYGVDKRVITVDCYELTARHFAQWAEKQKEQKPIKTSEEKEYIRTLKNLISGFIRDKQPEDVAYYQRVYDWLDGRHIEQKPVEYLDKDKVYAIMTKLTNLSYSTRIPINSDEYKKLNEITTEVRSLLDYPIEQQPVEWTELTWKDIVELEGIINNVHYDFSAGIGQESFGKEVLERFRSSKGIEYLDESEQKHWREEEQKPDTIDADDLQLLGFIYDLLNEIEWKDNWAMSKDECLRRLNNYRPQKPAEWSKEDEKMLRTIISDGSRGVELDSKQISWLKSLRPQSKDEIYKEKDEAFKLGKHQLAIKFMNYLDENRSEGKMSLSNGECEDIDKAFKENDWAKIMRYVDKYRPSWKPSKAQMKALLNAEKYLNAGLQYGSAKRVAELIEQLTKLGVEEEPEF